MSAMEAAVLGFMCGGAVIGGIVTAWLVVNEVRTVLEQRAYRRDDLRRWRERAKDVP